MDPAALSYPFSEIERAAWKPPEQLGTSEWAERYRVIALSSTPGPYRVSRTPYARGIMDALSDPRFNEVVFQKPVQCGGSELARNWIARNADVDPGPTMIVFPTEQSCREQISERIIPMFKNSPRLRNLLTGNAWDLKKNAIHLRSMSIYPGWSGSPQSLASRPIRYAILDEVDKYAPWAGKEADPSALAEARTTTYRHNRKIFKVSTPTLPNGNIVKALNACADVRDYCVRCVHCSEFHPPVFENLDWEGKDASSEEDVREVMRRLEVGEVVPRYKCPECQETMTPAQFRAATKRGRWVSVGYRVGEHPESKSVGFRLSGLCAIPGTLGVAIEYMKTRIMGLGRLQHFYNSVLGLPFWDEENWGDPNLEVTYSKVHALAEEGARPMVVPEWANTVVIGADTSKKGHQYTTYAVGPDYRMQLLDYGECLGSELLQMLYTDFKKASGEVFRVRRICVDVGGSNSPTSTRTEDVYRLALQDPTHVWPVKGSGYNTPRTPIQTSVHTYAPPGKNKSPFDVKSSILDVNYLKDLLALAINEGRWTPHCQIDFDFIKQMSSEKKELVERKIKPDESVVEVWRWKPKTAGIPNHFWDATVYALAAAKMLEAGEPQVELEETRPQVYYEEESSWDVGRRSSSWI